MNQYLKRKREEREMKKIEKEYNKRNNGVIWEQEKRYIIEQSTIDGLNDNTMKFFYFGYLGSGCKDYFFKIKYKRIENIPFNILDKYKNIINWEYVGSESIPRENCKIAFCGLYTIHCLFDIFSCCLFQKFTRYKIAPQEGEYTSIDELPDNFIERYVNYLNWKMIGSGTELYNDYIFFKKIEDLKPEFVKKYEKYINWKYVGSGKKNYTKAKCLPKEFIMTYHKNSKYLQFEYNVLTYDRVKFLKELEEKENVPRDIGNIIYKNLK